MSTKASLGILGSPAKQSHHSNEAISNTKPVKSRKNDDFDDSADFDSSQGTFIQ